MANERTGLTGPDIDKLRWQLRFSILKSLEDARAEIPPVTRIAKRKMLILKSFPQTPAEGEQVAFRVARRNFEEAVRQGVSQFKDQPYARQYQTQLLSGAAYIEEVVAQHLVKSSETPLVTFLDENLVRMQKSFDLHPERSPEGSEEIKAGLLGARLFVDFLAGILQKPPVLAGRNI